MNLSEKEEGLENVHVVVLETPKLLSLYKRVTYVQKVLLAYADEFSGPFDLLYVCYTLPVDGEAGIHYAHLVDIHEYHAALVEALK